MYTSVSEPVHGFVVAVGGLWVLPLLLSALLLRQVFSLNRSVLFLVRLAVWDGAFCRSQSGCIGLTDTCNCSQVFHGSRGLTSYLPACTAHGLLSHLPGSPRQLTIKLCTCNISVSLKFSPALQPCRCRVSQGTFTRCKQS